ncbi:MAG: outer membrane protein assembly factor BamE [Alphaproteobacteria bacterium]|nr:outer membrane protein assembly factor BamE [Alphaproteobacteria bacterium]
MLIGTAALTLAACAETVNQRGYVPDEDIISEIRPGVDNRTSVESALGTPTVQPVIDDDTWYYISRTQEHVAFFRPDTTEHQVVAITFDESGYVDNIGRLGMDDMRKIDPVGKKTPTRGKELGFFEQIFSNIGRFSGGGPAQPGQ